MSKRLWPAVVLGAILAAPSISMASAAGSESASFLDIPVGAGPAALGSAYSALATDAYAPVWNPAGLGFLKSTQVAGQHLSYLQSIYDEFASAVFRLKEGHALGVSAQYLGSGDIPGAALDGTVQPDYSAHYGAYTLAYGQKIGSQLSLGLSGKWINAKISDVSSNAYAADLGALYKVGENLSLAATLNNLGNRLKFLNDDSSLPMAGHLGAAYRPERHFLISLEGVFPKSGPQGAHVGLQWQPIDLIAVRAGYRTDTTKELGALAGFSTGMGLNLWGQEFSYAWVPYGDLGNTQYFSLVLRFGESEKSAESLSHSGQDKYNSSSEKIKEDPEGNQLMELFKDEPDRNALAPAVPVKAAQEKSR